MNYLKIETIEDLEPYIKDYPWFKRVTKEGITAIVYSTFSYGDFLKEHLDSKIPMFPNQESLECRGIMFDAQTGEILARPFNKFFNLHECLNDMVGRDLKDAIVLEKLDGSMVVPIIHLLSKEVRLCTKQGIGLVSVLVESLTNISRGVLKEIIQDGYTPIFEFTSPEQRIILKYGDSRMTLLAVRHMVNGNYCDELQLREFTLRLNVPLVYRYEGSIALEEVAKWEGKEGVVLLWPDNFRVKVKAEKYVLYHKAIEGIVLEKNRVAIVLHDGVDDFGQVLSEDKYQALLEYQSKLCSNITQFATKVMNVYTDVMKRGITKKAIATRTGIEMEDIVQYYLFRVMNNNLNREGLINQLKKDIFDRTSSAIRLEDLRSVIDEDIFHVDNNA